MTKDQKEEPTCLRVARSMEGIAEEIKKAAKVIENQPEKIEEMIKMLMGVRQTAKVFILAEGRSGRMSEAFAIRLMHLGFNNVFVMMRDTIVQKVSSDDVVVVISGTGTTNTVVAKIRSIIEKRVKAKIIAITSQPESLVGKWADLVIELPGRDSPYNKEQATKDKEPPLSPLGSRFEINALAFLEATVRELMRITKTTEKQMAERHEI